MKIRNLNFLLCETALGRRGSFHGERGVSSNMQQSHAAGVRLWIPKEYQLTPPVRRRPNFQSHEPREPRPSSRSERCHSLTGCRVSPRTTSPIPDPFRPPFPRTHAGEPAAHGRGATVERRRGLRHDARARRARRGGPRRGVVRGRGRCRRPIILGRKRPDGSGGDRAADRGRAGRPGRRGVRRLGPHTGRGRAGTGDVGQRQEGSGGGVLRGFRADGGHGVRPRARRGGAGEQRQRRGEGDRGVSLGVQIPAAAGRQ